MRLSPVTYVTALVLVLLLGLLVGSALHQDDYADGYCNGRLADYVGDHTCRAGDTVIEVPARVTLVED